MWVARAARRGELQRLLPGVYCPAGMQDHLPTRCSAIMAADPNAVIAGRAAAAITWWPQLAVGPVTAYRTMAASAQSGFTWWSGAVPAELVRTSRGVRYTAPELTVLDLIPDLGGQAIDEALRRGITLGSLHEALALTPGRPGNVERRWLLDDSRDEPWSELERAFHRRYRTLRISHRYRTNLRVDLGDGVAFIDFALPGLMLGFEPDGYEHHSSRRAFEHDRRRDAQLTALGWQIVRLTWAMLQDPDFDRLLLGIIAARELAIGLPRELPGIRHPA